MVGLVSMFIGVGIGAGADPQVIANAEAAAADAEAALADAVGRAAEDEASSAEIIDDLESRLAVTEAERDDATATARAELEQERAALLSEAGDAATNTIEDATREAEKLLSTAEARVSALDTREAELDERASELDVVEERKAANSFGNGIHVVGQDISPGTYRTAGGGNCYWARLSGLSGEFGDLIANGLPDGPATIQIRASDAGFESTGCGEWTRTD